MAACAATSRWRASRWCRNTAPATGLGQFVLMKDGQALYRFQHRRLHEWPPDGGTSTCACRCPYPGTLN
jgi:hypothetical protein